MTTLVDVKELEIDGSQAIVRPTSLSVRAGVPLTILGETGCGKTLLAQAIMGNLPDGLSARGQITLAGREFDAAKPGGRRALWGREITILPQEPWLALDPTMRAAPQVEETYRLVRRCPGDEARRRTAADLRALALNGAGRKLPAELSGGMAQRVAFAAARAGGARIVIADEPTKGLDAARRDDAVALLRKEVEEQGGLLTITHDVDVARGLGGEVAIMREGEIVERGPAEQVLQSPQTSYARQLLAAEPAAWPARMSDAGNRQIVVEAQSLAKSRGGAELFRDLSFELRAGEIVGVFGESGSGKSTLGDMVLGVLPPDAGTVRRAPEVDRIRFQKLYQDPPAAFPPYVTLRQALGDMLRRHRLDPAAVAPLMRQLRLDPILLDRRPAQVSGGELQRIALLRVLLLDPVFLFADEPTSRLDLITQQQTIEMIVGQARDRDCAVLIVSHDRTLVEKVADRVISI